MLEWDSLTCCAPPELTWDSSHSNTVIVWVSAVCSVQCAIGTTSRKCLYCLLFEIYTYDMAFWASPVLPGLVQYSLCCSWLKINASGYIVHWRVVLLTAYTAINNCIVCRSYWNDDLKVVHVAWCTVLVGVVRSVKTCRHCDFVLVSLLSVSFTRAEWHVL